MLSGIPLRRGIGYSQALSDWGQADFNDADTAAQPEAMIFISYARADRPRVAPLAAALTARAFDLLRRWIKQCPDQPRQGAQVTDGHCFNSLLAEVMFLQPIPQQTRRMRAGRVNMNNRNPRQHGFANNLRCATTPTDGMTVPNRAAYRSSHNRR